MIALRMLASLLLLAAPLHAIAADDAPQATYIVSIQHVDVAPDERIGKFRIDLACAQILSISGIPWDWHLSMDNVGNCETYVDGGVFHGSGMIEKERLRELKLRVIKHEIKNLDRTFSLSGQLLVTKDFGETQHFIDLKPSDFRVEQAP
jgi:hypothetical protein